MYERAKNDRKYVICDEQHPKPPGKLCLFDTNTMGPCGKPDYGYPEIKPCLYLKLNKVTKLQWKFGFSILFSDISYKVGNLNIT